MIPNKSAKYKPKPGVPHVEIPCKLWLVITTCQDKPQAKIQDIEMPRSLAVAASELKKCGSPFDAVYWLEYSERHGGRATAHVVENVPVGAPQKVLKLEHWQRLTPQVAALCICKNSPSRR